MLNKFGHTHGGVPLIVVGLSKPNMHRLLLTDESITIHLPQAAAGLAGMPTCTIVLVGGQTEADIADQIADSDIARFFRDNPVTPERPQTIVATRRPTDG